MALALALALRWRRQQAQLHPTPPANPLPVGVGRWRRSVAAPLALALGVGLARQVVEGAELAAAFPTDRLCPVGELAALGDGGALTTSAAFVDCQGRASALRAPEPAESSGEDSG